MNKYTRNIKIDNFFIKTNIKLSSHSREAKSNLHNTYGNIFYSNDDLKKVNNNKYLKNNVSDYIYNNKKTYFDLLNDNDNKYIFAISPENTTCINKELHSNKDKIIYHKRKHLSKYFSNYKKKNIALDTYNNHDENSFENNKKKIEIYLTSYAKSSKKMKKYIEKQLIYKTITKDNSLNNKKYIINKKKIDNSDVINPYVKKECKKKIFELKLNNNLINENYSIKSIFKNALIRKNLFFNKKKYF